MKMQNAEMSLKKAENMMAHADAIYSRPARTWFQTLKEKEASKLAGSQKRPANDDQTNTDSGNEADDPYSVILAEETEKALSKTGMHGQFDGLKRKQKRRKMMMAEEDEAELAQQLRQQKVVAKSAKKEARINPPFSLKKDKKKGKKGKKRVAAGFESDLTQSSKASIMGGRSGRKVLPKGKFGKKRK
jgi:ATP-dependent RNA helicase DDX27